MDHTQLSLDLGEMLAPTASGRARRRRTTGRSVVNNCGLESKYRGMGSPAAAVAAFHVAFDLSRRLTPNIVDVSEDLIQLRIALLEEEVVEFREAAQRRDLVGVADGLADIVYVAYGAAICFGIDLDAVIAEVHRANMTKLGEDGRPVLRADGKVCKSNRYRSPDIAAVLAEARVDPMTSIASGS